MKKTFIVFLIITLTAFDLANCQSFPKKFNWENYKTEQFNFEVYNTKYRNEIVEFYVYKQNIKDSINTIVLDIAGSSANPTLRYKVNEDSSVRWFSKIPMDIRNFPKNWTYVIVSKIGMPFCDNKDSI